MSPPNLIHVDVKWRFDDTADGGTLRGRSWFLLQIQAETQIGFMHVTLIQFSWQSKQYIMYRSAWRWLTLRFSWR